MIDSTEVTSRDPHILGGTEYVGNEDKGFDAVPLPEDAVAFQFYDYRVYDWTKGRVWNEGKSEFNYSQIYWIKSRLKAVIQREQVSSAEDDMLAQVVLFYMNEHHTDAVALTKSGHIKPFGPKDEIIDL